MSEEIPGLSTEQQDIACYVEIENNSSEEKSLPVERATTDPVPPDFLPLFVCPHCFNYTISPIYQCQNGHVFCDICRKKLDYCPICKIKLGSDYIRNDFLEKLANSIYLFIKFEGYSCKISCLPPQKKDHDEICDYNPFNYLCTCPSEVCCQRHWFMKQHFMKIPQCEQEETDMMSVAMNAPSTKRRGTGSSMVSNNSSSSSNSTSQATGSNSATVSVPVSADLASLFECPVCFDYVLPPILQCQSGHLVCSSCRPKLTCCPTCRGPLGNIRNLAMEKVASTVLFPCKYSTSGCTMSLLHTQKTEHEEVCEYRPYSCPCPGASCKWQGALEQVMPHLMMSHKSITTLQGEDIVFLATDINLPGAVDWVMMQSCFGHNFMLVLEKQEKYDGHQQFFAIVQLIGSRKQAENFAYRLELNGHRRRLTWEATPRSIHEGVSSAILNSDCLVFDTTIAQLFADTGNLGINVTISMV